MCILKIISFQALVCFLSQIMEPYATRGQTRTRPFLFQYFFYSIFSLICRALAVNSSFLTSSSLEVVRYLSRMMCTILRWAVFVMAACEIS